MKESAVLLVLKKIGSWEAFYSVWFSLFKVLTMKGSLHPCHYQLAVRLKLGEFDR